MTIQSEIEEKRILQKIVSASEEFLQSAGSELDYQKITDDILDISGAKYAGFNLFDEDGGKFTTMAFSAPDGALKEVSSLLGFKIPGKKWDYDPVRYEKIRLFTLNRFSSLTELTGDIIPSGVVSLLEKTFKTGEVIIVKILKENVMLGDFTLIMPDKVKFKNDYYVELYTRQLGLLIDRNRGEARLLESEMRLRSVFASVGDPLFMIDQKTGAILDVNDAACGLYGYERDEMLQLKDVDMSAEPKETEKATKNFKAYIPVRYHKKKDGNVFPVEITARLIELNGRKTIMASMRDITERKQAEDLLVQTRQNYETFFNSIDDFLFVLDEQGRILHTNTTVIKRLGYTIEELLGQSVLIIHPPDRRDEAGRIVGEMLSGTTEFCPVPVITKSGMQIPVETRVLPGIWNGKPVLFGVSKDISKIKLSEEKFSKLFHINPSACGLSDLENHKYIEVNDAFYTLFGFDKDEVIGRTASDLGLLNKETISAIILKANKDGNTTNIEADLKAKNGDIKHVLLSSENIYVQDKKYRFTVVNDITERKKAEVALQQSEKRHRLLVENSHDIIYTIDLNGVFTFVSPSWTQILGHPVSEVEGKPFQPFVHPDDIAVCMAFMQKVVETGQSQTGVEYRVKHSDGSWRWHLSNALPLFNQSGTVEGLEGSASDITERKQTEKEILYLSYHDKLTGLYNRRFYEVELNRLDTKRNLPLTLVIADVNGLKMANDAFGHLIGDRLLVKVAAAIKKESRIDDIVARIGGDEFVLLLPGTPLEDAEKIVARINEKFSHYKLGNVIVSASFGFASKLQETESIDDIFKKAEDNMYRQKLSESFNIRNKIVGVIMQTLYEKSENEQEHAELVGLFCESLGRAYGLSIAETLRLKTAGMMHGIGKISIDEKILNKPGKLSDSEWIVIKRHPETGYRILSSTIEFSQIAKYILAHHERWDGQGYPKGLKGPEIPLEARIIAIADAYSAMTGYRPYKEAINESAAIKEIKANAGTQFDPDISRIFVEKVLNRSWI